MAQSTHQSKSKKTQQSDTQQSSQNKQGSQARGLDTILASPMGMEGLNIQDVVQLQRLLGNSAVQRLIPPQSSPATQSSELKIQRRIWTPDIFKNATKLGKLKNNSTRVKAITKLLDDYFKIPPIDERIQIAEEILEHTKNYIEDHEGSKKVQKRVVAMKNFKGVVEGEIVLLKAQKQKRLDKGIELDETTRESNLDKIKEKHEGSAKSLFTKLAFLVDSAVPTTGDKSKIEIEFKFPVDPSGVGFIGGRFMIECERPEKNLVKVRNEVTAKGGGTIGGIAEISAELGGYMESQAQDSDKVLKLLSYAFYRRFEESKVLPRKLSNYAWGGDSGVKGFRKAERWASNVEKEVFGSLAYDTDEDKEKAKNTYVETGGMGSVGTEVNVGIGKAKGQVKGTAGTRYDRASIEARKQGGLGSKRSNYTFGVPQEKIGTGTKSVEVSGGLEAGPFGGEGKVKWSWIGSQPVDWEIEASASAQMPMGQLVGNGLAPYIGGVTASIVKIIRAAKEDTMNKSQGTGVAQSIGENVTLGITQIAQLPKESFVPKYEVEVPKDGIEGTAGVKLTLKFGSGGGEFLAEIVKTVGVNLGVFSGKMEKGERIIRIAYAPSGDPNQPGKWTVD